MLYGWIEVGASNNTLFSNEVDQDIILRTIYNNKIIIGNTDGISAKAAVYVVGNNVGMKKVPQSNVSLDVDGFAVLKSAQVGISNLPTYLCLNGDFIVKDITKNYDPSMQMVITNSNAQIEFKYNGIKRFKMSDGQGIDLNDNIYVTNDVYANAYHLTSDSRFKQNITQSCPKADTHIIQSLQISDYQLINNPDRQIKGFIAQNIEQVLPQAVTEVGDKKTIDINQITAVNSSVIQDLLKRISKIETILNI